MNILEHTTIKVQEENYVIDHPKFGIVRYKEYLDERGKVIDTVIRSKGGYDMSEEVGLVHEIWDYLNALDNEKGDNV